MAGLGLGMGMGLNAVRGSPYALNSGNLIVNPDAFDNASWGKFAGAATADQGIAPDGTTTMDKFTPDVTNVAGHQVATGNITIPNSPIRVSVVAKAAGYTKFALRENTMSGNYAAFDLTGGTVIEAGVPYAVGAATGAAITSLGNGLYQAQFVFTPAAGGTATFGIWVLPASYTTGSPDGVIWTPDGTSGVLLWRAQAYP